MPSDEPRWSPQPRPAWVATLNDFGRNLGPSSALVHLDEASLLDAATELTGLTDFGPDDWREPFRLLVKDINEVSEPTLTGRIMARHDLIRSLIVRLHMAEAERANPAILEREIIAPIFITGMGRTGTSILFELLNQDPELRAPLGWELRFPYPLAERGSSETRIAKTTTEIDLWDLVGPEFAAIHEVSVEGPDEDSVAHQHEFASPVWSALHRAPNYDNWLNGSGMVAAFRFHHRLLQHLQGETPVRWLFKAPAHLATLSTLFAEYPDASVIQTHRDPLKVLASTADMLATLRWQRSDRVEYGEIAEAIGFGYPILLDMVIDQRATGAVPDERFVDVRYADLMADHLATIGAIYDRLGLELTDHAAGRMRDYLAAKPKGRHGGRDYRFEDLGLDHDLLRGQFAAYMERFGVPEEAL